MPPVLISAAPATLYILAGLRLATLIAIIAGLLLYVGTRRTLHKK